MTEVSTIVWLVKDRNGNQLGTVVDNDHERALNTARTIYSHLDPEDLTIEDSGTRKMKCCDKCKDVPCGTPEGQF